MEQPRHRVRILEPGRQRAKLVVILPSDQPPGQERALQLSTGGARELGPRHRNHEARRDSKTPRDFATKRGHQLARALRIFRREEDRQHLGPFLGIADAAGSSEARGDARRGVDHLLDREARQVRSVRNHHFLLARHYVQATVRQKATIPGTQPAVRCDHPLHGGVHVALHYHRPAHRDLAHAPFGQGLVRAGFLIKYAHLHARNGRTHLRHGASVRSGGGGLAHLRTQRLSLDEQRAGSVSCVGHAG